MSDQKKNDFWSPENLKSLFILIVLIFAFRSSIASPYHVPTASMEPTIKVGDRLLAFKLAYELRFPFLGYSLVEWGKPERGDIIVFDYPQDPSVEYVKRVIGLPGDRISIRNNVIFINGVAQERTDHEYDRSILVDIEDNPPEKHLYQEQLSDTKHWVMQNRSEFRRLRQNFPSEGEIVVPEQSYFVMGDNRDNSTDSREWGFVPEENIRGKAMFVLWSLKTDDDSFLNFSLRWDRIGHVLI